jgi:peptidoglycan/xylan/chitin deacetylase (PgdA/CDA1 family)
VAVSLLRRRRPVVVSLTFDDGRASQAVARRLLAAHGLRGTFYLNSGLVGREGHLDWHAVDALAADGHEIGGHTISHPDLAALDATAAAGEVAGDRDALTARGYAVSTFAYPFGSGYRVRAVRDALAGAGYTATRRAWGLQEGDRPAAESLPPADPWAVRTPPGVVADHPPEALQRMVLAAERRGGWVPLVFHDVGDGWGDRYTTPVATFDALLAWLTARGTAVRTVGELLSGR